MNAPLPWLDHINDDIARLVATLPTATLLLDPQRSNALAAAQRITAAALCLNPQQHQPCKQCKSCHQLHVNAHPDRIWRTIPAKTNDIRTLTEQLQRTPTIAKRRIIFLADIDQYNDYALNALLKTLEEPPASNHFLISAPNRRAVKPTILSRARCLPIPAATPAQALHWLCTVHHQDETQATAALAMQQNNPFRALSDTPPPDPGVHITDCIAFLRSPRSETAYLMHLDTLDPNQLIDYVSAQLSALIQHIQFGTSSTYWQNHLVADQTAIAELDLPRLHSLYARISALRRPNQQQTGIAANIKGHLLDIMDNPIPIL